MIITDRLYGKQAINSPVAAELIKSPPFQRLKRIHQFGIPDEYYHIKNYSRYTHSIGVYLLLRKLKASEEEQIAGLLHDVSHTAFSHIIDWVVGEGKDETFQDGQHMRFFQRSIVRDILEKYGMNPAAIADHHSFSLLDRDIPHLCADRIDYALREMPKEMTGRIVPKLRSFNGAIVFADKDTAVLFGKEFLKLQKIHWGGYEGNIRFFLFSRALRFALKLNIIDKNDFWRDDIYVINKLKKAHDKNIDEIMSILRKKNLSSLPQGTQKIYKKFRYVDPEYWVNGKILPLSRTDPVFKEVLTREKDRNRSGIVLPLIAIKFDNPPRLS